jgi:lipoprotein-releasing system permease protein
LNIALFISKRYLFSPKSNNAINAITLISMIGIAVGTAAMILVLSVFNGLTGFIEDLFSAMDSDLRIESSEGKSFTDDSILYEKVAKFPGVKLVSRTIEEKAILNYFDRQAGAVMKGVDKNFVKINPIDAEEFLYEGTYSFDVVNEYPRGVLGSQVAATLNASTNDIDNPIKIFVKTQGAIKIGNPMLSFKNELMFPAGYFSVQKEYDERYVLIDLDFARDLFNYQDRLTAYEIGLENPENAEDIKKDLQKMLGKSFQVLTLRDKHATLYKVMRNEKLVSYLILTLLLIIVSVNIIGCLSMIVLEKTRDIAVLKAMGATDNLIRRVFLMEGLLVGGIGCIAGVIIALVLAVLQMQYGFLKLNGGASFRVDAFPIALNFWDFVGVILTVVGLSVLASIYPAKRAMIIEVSEGIKH